MKYVRNTNKPFIPGHLIGFHQEGGEMQGQGDPMQQMLMLAQQALETQDCQDSMAVCEMFLQLAAGQGGAPEGAPADAAMPPQ